MKRAELANMIDHTLLKPEATTEDVDALIAEASDLGTYSVCVSPSMLPIEVPESLAVAVVCGFPSGAHSFLVKAMEAASSVAAGAQEIDVVANLSFLKEHDWISFEHEIAMVRLSAPEPAVLKVILETAALTDEEIIEACKACEEAGADYVKTSTGFHPAGGASVHAVELMANTVGGRLGVKASGGIRTYAQAMDMINAGATRLGLSASRAILEGAE
ncbi:MAG: deoxyribose-phosphate aldolase [Actinomycetaceae bacterium]|nr:deoxyribose-phosphate aldolase [Actinomycetaceae bacterium]